MTEVMKERDFVQEVLQNFKEDYSSLADPTYCSINVGFGSLERGINTVHDNHSIKIDHHNDLYFERIDGIIKRFIQMSSVPSMKGRRSMDHSNITVVISILNNSNRYSGRIYELQLQKDGSLLLIDAVRKNN